MNTKREIFDMHIQKIYEKNKRVEKSTLLLC